MTTSRPVGVSQESIKARPHWHIIIKPTRFVEERFPLPIAWELIDTCQVRLRGWPYPYISRDDRRAGNDWISSASDSSRHTETWTLFQSGQFEHFLSFEEDAFRDRAEERAREDIDFPSHFTPSGYLDVILGLYRMTEIFEFASRFARKAFPSESLTLTIGMYGIKDRVLFVMDPMRAWWGFYRATEPVLEKTWPVEYEALITNGLDLALDAAVWFFERFGWMELPRQTFREEQRKLIERRA